LIVLLSRTEYLR